VTRRRADLVTAGLVVAGLLAGCSGGDGDIPEQSTTTSGVPSSAHTPPPISPGSTAPTPSGSPFPQTLSPSFGTGVPIPIPSDQQT
jgi:hypothetical protein